MDAVTDPATHTVVVMSSAQVGKTELILNTVGYFIDQDPSPILLVQPTVEMAQAWSKDRLAPMLRDTPALRGKVKDPRSRDSGNTMLHKTFPGGHITMGGANSPAGLASRPIRVVLLDEVDRYPPSAGSEGDPVRLALKRSTTFWNRKAVLTSTPTIEGRSRIQRAFEDSDKRLYHVPCPDCAHPQVLRWQQVKWTGDDPETAGYVCEDCGSVWNDAQRWRAIKAGEWVATASFAGTAGFWLSELYSPWKSLAETVRDFLTAKNDPVQLQTFVNTALGETWREQGEAPEWQRLLERREAYRKPPASVMFLTAGADVQKDRIELHVWGWGVGKESWLLSAVVLPGDTSRAEVWEALTAAIGGTWETEDGRTLPLLRVAVDSGYATSEVYAWARRQAPGRVMVVKGFDQSSAIVGQPRAVDVTHRGKRLARGIKVWPVGSSIIKSETYGWLRMDRPAGDDPAPGFVHLPTSVDDEFCKQLTAEALVTRIVKGYRRPEWQKTRDRNEALDCRVYARAAAAALGLDRGLAERIAAELGKRAPEPEGEAPTPAPPKAQRRAPARRPGWIRRGW